MIWRKLKDWERKTRDSFTHDIVDPEQRKKSQFFTDWIDHGILRYHWHNFFEFAPGMYRSNQPNHKRLEAYAKLGVKNILNLRGANGASPYVFEVESCEQLGLTLIDHAMSARSAPEREKVLKVIEILENLDGPTLLHCKSGADRTGLVSAIYRLHIQNLPFKEARKMLSIRFVHLNITRTGILDYVIHEYGQRNAQSPISFKDWVTNEYDQDASAAAFKAMPIWQRIKL